MNLWIFAIFCSSFFQLAICAEDVIKDTTFVDFGVKDSYIVYGKGQQFKMKGVGYRTCSGGIENEVWLVANTLNVNQTIYDVKLHIEIESQMEKCENRQGICFKDGFELFTYNGEGEPKVPFTKNPEVNVEKEKEKAREFFHNNFTYLGNITGNATSKELVNTSFTLNLKEFREITFGIKSRGGCGKVNRMKVYYYVCDQTFIKSVMFKKTSAPQNGTTEVVGNCSANTVPVSRMGNLRAYCHSNGSWSTEEDRDMVCMCVKGYEPTTDHGCSACQSGLYKPSDSNKDCMKCPKNTINNTNRTTCVCKSGYYELPSDIKSENPPLCYAPIKIESKPTVDKQLDDDNSVNITWSPLVNKSGIPNEVIVYDILCYICIESVCNKSCEDLTYIPNQYNVTRTSVRVSGLVPGQSYKFRIFPKNNLNYRIPKEDWNFIESESYTFQSKDNMKESKGEKSNLTYLVVIVSVACLTLLLVVLLIAFFLRKRKEKKSLFPGLITNGVELPTRGKKTYVDPTNYDRPEDAICEFATEIDASRLYLEMLIGGGEFGDVYKGSMTDADGKKHPIAVKTLKKDATAKSEKDFLMEASVMGQFDCPNVIKLEGVVTKFRPWMIIIEFMSNGSLDHFLKANDGRLSHLELITMAKGVAVGMEYLATMKFVHRDLAARNVLVDGNLICKVCDFGLSRELETTDSSRGEYATTGGKIPIRWTAPEATKYRKFSSASDVWSFGILLWEIMSFSERPYWEWDNFKVMEEVDKGFRLPAPLNCPKGVHDLMMECWKQDRVVRPNFTEINAVIDGWIQAPKTMEGDVDLCAALREWLQSIKMEEYVKNFTAAGYQRPCELYGIKEDDLKEMGINLVGHRNKILKGIRNLQGKKKGGKQALKREVSLEV